VAAKESVTGSFPTIPATMVPIYSKIRVEGESMSDEEPIYHDVKLEHHSSMRKNHFQFTLKTLTNNERTHDDVQKLRFAVMALHLKRMIQFFIKILKTSGDSDDIRYRKAKIAYVSVIGFDVDKDTGELTFGEKSRLYNCAMDAECLMPKSDNWGNDEVYGSIADILKCNLIVNGKKGRNVSMVCGSSCSHYFAPEMKDTYVESCRIKFRPSMILPLHTRSGMRFMRDVLELSPLIPTNARRNDILSEDWEDFEIRDTENVGRCLFCAVMDGLATQLSEKAILLPKPIIQKKQIVFPDDESPSMY